MKDVAAKVLQAFAKPVEQRGGSLEALLAGTSVTPAMVRSSSSRMEWAELCVVFRNLQQWCDDDDLVEIGRSFLRTRAIRWTFVIGRVLLSPMGFYRWMNTPKKGAGNQVFACVTPSFREIAPDRCEIELTLPDGYEVCWPFFLTTLGSLEEVPRLLGYGPANVELWALPNGGVFQVTIPSRTPILTRLRRTLMWPFTVRAAARELKEVNETLVERYEQLEQTRDELERYKTNLEQMVEDRTRELREARDQLSHTVEQLREAEGVRTRFFGNVSHEIRTPLSLILLAASEIERRAGAPLDSRGRGHLSTITDGAHKLVRLVDELLLLAAGQEDKLEVVPEPTDVGALIGKLVIAWGPAAAVAGLDLVTRAPASLVANVDPVAFERIASNLVSNAVKYTPRGGRVEIELEPRDADIELAVLDTGAGIPADLTQRLFGRFERASGADRRKVGTGLGLWLVRQLVEAHGGSIAASPRAGGGTELRARFPRAKTTTRIALPAVDLRVGVAVVRDVLPSGTRLDPPGPSEGTILLAEDDPQLAETIARLLADQFAVVIAHDGEQALALARKHQPQLLITDVEMPGMTGIELASKFRELSGDALAPIIVVSAVIDLKTRLAGLDAGAIDYVTKPFEPIELLARVRSQFRMRDLALRLHRAEHLSSLGILTSGLAHELRNPVNGIVNAITPLTRLLPAELSRSDAPVGQLLTVMLGCAEQVKFLSRELLGLRGDEELTLRPARIDDLIARALLFAEDALAGVQVRLDIEDDLSAPCAAPMLVQVLTNLIENGAHAAGTDGWIAVDARRIHDRVVIVISDSGPGVPVELRERVFEPFFTTKSPDRGSGLGLSISRTIVHRHRGVLEIREQAGRSTFVIELPSEPAASRLALAAT